MSTPSCSGASSEGGRTGLAAQLGILAIEAYRVLLAPLVGGYCRYVPSCSLYAREALGRHGLLRGGWLALRRVSRCHPFHPGGIDPVP